ncbi:MAG: shikimate kinase [Kiritimatiellae bacterium]|nr:shikimate kinase [Kiritimatiellia bacterium]MDD5521494.1 shikimate kinase [Kiritimatiellia bacterium]
MQTKQRDNTSMQNIVLVGFMGTGKTSVGKLLASELKMTFLDMDDVIKERAGKPISRIFAEDGETYFRSLERTLVKDLSCKKGLVIATGGGIVLNPDNISDFTKTGLVVCLLATSETILKRVSGDTNRPLLSGDDKMKKILNLMESRRHLYEAIPHKIDTTNLSLDNVVNQVIKLFT